MEDMFVMSRDGCVARVIGDQLKVEKESLLPIGLKRTGDITEWLTHRAIDHRRVNARLLKKALRLENKDDVHTVLKFNAATITDRNMLRRLY